MTSTMLDKVGPGILVTMFTVIFASSVYSSSTSFTPVDIDSGFPFSQYVTEFGPLGIVAFVVYWMMNRIDQLISNMEKAQAIAANANEEVSKQNVVIADTQKTIVRELRNLARCVDKHHGPVDTEKHHDD